MISSNKQGEQALDQCSDVRGPLTRQELLWIAHPVLGSALGTMRPMPEITPRDSL